MAPSIDDEIDRLYGLAPEDFVAARNALAKSVRGVDRDAGDRVAALRRPSIPAWALNQLVRTHRSAMEGLVEAGERLRVAQEQMVAGRSASGFREAVTRRRDAISRLTEEAVALLRESSRAPGPHIEGIAATLEAASADPEAASLLLSGRLTKDVAPPTGLGQMGIPPDAEEGSASQRGPTGRRGGRASGLGPSDVAEATIRAREADQAERTAHRAEQEARRARAAADRLRERATLAESAARESEHAATTARREALRARGRAARLESRRG